MHNSMGFRHFRDDVSPMEILSLLHRDMCLPFFLPVKRVYADAPCDKCASGRIRDLLQGTLDTVEDVVQDAGSKGHGHRVSGGNDFLPGVQACCFLVYLDSRHIFIKGNDLANKLLSAHIDHLGHRETGIALQIDDRAVDPIDCSGLKHCPHLPGR